MVIPTLNEVKHGSTLVLIMAVYGNPFLNGCVCAPTSCGLVIMCGAGSSRPAVLLMGLSDLFAN